MDRPLDFEINFIPAEPGQRKLIRAVTSMAVATLLAGWLGFSYWHHGMELTEKGMANAQLADQLNHNQAQHDILAGFQVMEKDIEVLRTAAARASEGSLSQVAVLQEIFSLVPSGMELTEIEIKPGGVVVKGCCSDYGLLEGFVSAADSSLYLGNVGKIRSDNKMQGHQVEFVLEIEIKEVNG